MISDKNLPVTDSLPKEKPSFEAFRAARLAAVQALFQIHYTQNLALAVIQEFAEHRFIGHDDYPHAPDTKLFQDLVLKAINREDDIIRMIDANLSEPRTFAALEPVLRAILQIGVLELLEPVSSIPAPVIISEYIDITRGFLSASEAQLTNAVLDGIAKALNLPMKKNK